MLSWVASSSYLVKESLFSKEHLALIVGVQDLAGFDLFQQIRIVVKNAWQIPQTIPIARPNNLFKDLSASLNTLFKRRLLELE